MHGTFLFESWQHCLNMVTTKAFPNHNESCLVHLLKFPELYLQYYTVFSELKVAWKKLIPKLIQYYFKTTEIFMLIAIKTYPFCYTHYLILDSFKHCNLRSLSQILLGEVSGIYECCMHLKKYRNAFIILFYMKWNWLEFHQSFKVQ